MSDIELLKELVNNLKNHVHSCDNDDSFNDNPAWKECSELAQSISHFCESCIIKVQ